MGVQVNNLTQLWAADPGDATLGIIAGADGAFPFLSTRVGIDNNNCIEFSNGGTGLVAGNFYSGYKDGLAPFDMSSGQKIVFYFRNGGTPTFTSIQSLRMVLLNTGLTEYAYYEKTINTDVLDTTFQIMDISGTPTFQTGSYDNTQNTAIGVLIQTSDGGVFGIQAIFDQFQYIDPANPVEFTTDGLPGTVGMSDYFDFLTPSATASPEHTLLFSQLGGLLYEYGFALRVTHNDYNDGFTGLTMAPKPADGFNFTPLEDYYSLEWSPAGGTQILNSVAFPNRSTDQNLTLDGTSGTLTIDGLTAGGVDDVVLQGASLSLANAIIDSPENISLDDGLLDVTVNSPQSTLLMNSVLQTGSEIEITSPTAIALQINTEPLDHSGTTIRLPAAQMDLNGTTAGNYDLTGLENTDAGPISIDTLDTNTITADITDTVNAVSIDPNLTLVPPPEIAGISAPNLIGRVQLYNITQDFVVDDQTVVAGYLYTWTNGSAGNFIAGDQGELRFISETDYDIRIPFTATANTTQNFDNTPELDEAYAYYVTLRGKTGQDVLLETNPANGLSIFLLDGTNIRLNHPEIIGPNGPYGVWSIAEAYMWYKFARFVDPVEGFDFFDAVEVIDTARLRIKTANVDAFFDTQLTYMLIYDETDDVSIVRDSDPITPVLTPTTSGLGITVNTQDIQVAQAEVNRTVIIGTSNTTQTGGAVSCTLINEGLEATI